MRRRFTAFLLSFVMFLTLCSAPAFAVTYEPATTPILTLLPTALRRPVRPATLEQAGYPKAEGKEGVFQEIADLTDSLTAGKTSDREKVKAIYDWVSPNISYYKDMTGDVFDGYIQRCGSCGYYSALCQLMGTIAGIPVADITGMANEENPGLHAWNAALLDGEWLFFDVTWARWDIGANYHHWSDATCYDDIYKWDIRGGIARPPTC